MKNLTLFRSQSIAYCYLSLLFSLFEFNLAYGQNPSTKSSINFPTNEPNINNLLLSIESKTDSVQIRKIYDEELVNGKSYSNLHSLCFDVGERLSGTDKAAKAVVWGLEKLKALGLDSVYTQEVMVPHWERGSKESAYIFLNHQKISVPVCALGGSIATPKEGIKAPIVEIQQFDELAKLGKEKIQGKIVFYNRAFDQRYIITGVAYGNAVEQRVVGAIEAAKYGAIGVIIRSMSSTLDTLPHTGIMIYKEGIPKIPAAAISTQAADDLTQDLKQNPNLEFSFQQNCTIYTDTKSYNVVGELKGKTLPKQVILVGGHLDSWDLAQGAQDDGAGVVQSMEVLQLYKSLGIRPERTLRVIFFMSEENGSSGGKKYAEIALKNSQETHIAAIESDDGGFTPRGFGIACSKDLQKKFELWKPLFLPYESGEFIYSDEGVGADIEKLGKQSKALISYQSDSQRYFDIHHTANDRFSFVNQRELKLGAGAMASLVYLLDKYGL